MGLGAEIEIIVRMRNEIKTELYFILLEKYIKMTSCLIKINFLWNILKIY